MAGGTRRRELLVSTGWVQAMALTFVFGFFLPGLIGYKTYTGRPPIPERIVDPAGNVVFTGEDVKDGQKARCALISKSGVRRGWFSHGRYEPRDQCS